MIPSRAGPLCRFPLGLKNAKDMPPAIRRFILNIDVCKGKVSISFAKSVAFFHTHHPTQMAPASVPYSMWQYSTLHHNYLCINILSLSTGRKKVKVVPRPTWLAATISPL